MAGLEFYPKHNMVAYLEKTDGNTEFHHIMDFLTCSSINYALTVSPIVSTLFVEQFWTTAKSRTVNNTSYIDATVAGKPMTISEASIRSDLLFDDADGIDSLNNQAIFDTIQLMGHEGDLNTLTFNKALFSPPMEISFSYHESLPSPPTHIPDSIPEGSSGNHGGQSSNNASLSGNEDGLTLQSVYDLYGRKSVKSFKGEPSVHKDPAFDDLDDIVNEAIDYMESEDAQDKGGQALWWKNVTQTTPTPTSTPTPTIFGDDETIAQVLITMSQNKQKEKEKGVELRDVKETERPRPTSTRSILTLKPLPKIDLKDKGKKRIEEEDESDTESEGITEAEKKFKQLANDEKVDRKVQEEWEAEEEKKRLAEEEATKVALSNEYDFIQARLNADKILAEKLQEEEREMYTIEQRTKFLHDTIAAQRRFLAKQRSETIKNKPPLRNQLRNQMMTYLKHVGGKKHFDLKTKSFDEIQVLYEKIKRSDDSFIAIGSAEDEKVIKEMNEQAVDASKKRVKKDDSVKGEIKEEEGTRKRKLGKRKKMKSKKRKFTSKDDEELRLCLTIAPDEDKEVDYEILDKKYPIIEWRSEYLTTKPQYDETEEVEDVYLNVVIRSNRRRRYSSTLMALLSILDRDDICAIYQLVMNIYQDETPKGFDKILWGDLIIMFNQSDSDEFWNAQQNWKIVSWKLHSSSGVHTIMTNGGLVIHMFVEKKYPLKKEVLSQLIELKLETEEDNTMALELIRFVKKQIAELEPKDSNGDEEDP
ncbi:hypothetical protein Tco_0618317 [Tanacetum coccineum]